MSVSGITNSNLFNSTNQTIQSKMQQFQKEFQQLGQDLQSGNLSAAQSDFVTLQQMGPASATSSAQNNSPIAQAFNQLAQDLKSGNLSGAQQDFTQIQQAFRNQASQTHGHHRHHGGGEGGGMSKLIEQLGQALQSGDLSTAQTAYSSLVQAFPQLGQGGQPVQNYQLGTGGQPVQNYQLGTGGQPVQASSSGGVSVRA
jgi:outer membrane protein assembly factor BamD (BamD/ComL family)